ncbi:MAG: type II 3-dehydroquinate dehydratase [Bacteroidales bacterium]|nr:type II 3-dehydroquinate dehydratase [Bacteroidales bacterium]
MKKIAIINGPNLNLLGVREPEVYGRCTMDDVLTELHCKFPDVEIDYFQSNIEGELIDQVQKVGFEADGIVINAGGYSHTSVALHDALQSVPCQAIEVHISNIFSREEYRHHSLLSSACRGLVCGLGTDGYHLAIMAIINSTGKH